MPVDFQQAMKQKSLRRQRADILAVVARAESAVAHEVADAAAQQRAETQRVVARGAARHEYVELKDALRRAQAARVDRCVTEAGEGAAEEQRLQAQLRIDRARLEALAPAWKRQARGLAALLAKEGYANETCWRSRAKAALLELVAELERRHGTARHDGNAAARHARELVRRINLDSAAKAREGLERRVVPLADEAEARREPDAEYARLARAVAAAARDAAGLAAARREAAASAARGAETFKRTARHRLRQLELAHGADALRPPPQPFDFSQNFSVSLRADVSDLARLGAGRAPSKDERAAVAARFRRVLGRCAAAGAWQEAFEAFELLLERRLEADLYTFQTLVTACKNARPSQASKAVRIFDMMRAQGVTPTVAMANIVLGACGAGARWREALALFKRMRALGLRPNTATYAALVQACHHAKVDELPEMYDAMKFAGVPEFVALRTGQQRLARSKGSGSPMGPKSYFAAEWRGAGADDGDEDGDPSLSRAGTGTALVEH